jgi:dTDP-4-dehydrorhamnose reductase
MKKKVLILGSTGMLGNTVAKYFLDSEKYDVFLTYRNPELAFGGNRIRFDALKDSLDILPGNVDYVINCIGIIKQIMHDGKSVQRAIRLNALFPLELAEWCEQKNIRLIHITTDCVFSGAKGKYVESDEHDALDAYGKTKSLGEPVDATMVIRTSIIGEELHNNGSLVSWVKSMKGQSIKGYTNHFWNGITTLEYAKVCDKIIQNDLYENGLFHVFAADDVSKYQMLQMFNEKYDLGLTIDEFAPEGIDRTLRTEKTLCSKLQIPTVRQMIMDM